VTFADVTAKLLHEDTDPTLNTDRCVGCHNPCAGFAIPEMPHSWKVTMGSTDACNLIIKTAQMPLPIPIDGFAENNNPGLIYDRVFRRGDMPPKNQPQLDTGQLD